MKYVLKKHEAGEVHSHAPWRCPSPASLAGAQSPLTACNFPEQAEGDVTLPDLPHACDVFAQPWQNKDWLVSIPGPNARRFGHASTEKLRTFQKTSCKAAECSRRFAFPVGTNA